MSRTPDSEVAAQLARKRAPVIAVLDSGLDPFADLAQGTRVRAARSFVGGHACVDAAGTGTACAGAIAQAYCGRWTEHGPSEVELLVAQVVDADGTIRPEAVAHALGWAHALGAEAVAIGWRGADPVAVDGIARRLARAGVRLVDVREARQLVAAVAA